MAVATKGKPAAKTTTTKPAARTTGKAAPTSAFLAKVKSAFDAVDRAVVNEAFQNSEARSGGNDPSDGDYIFKIRADISDIKTLKDKKTDEDYVAGLLGVEVVGAGDPDEQGKEYKIFVSFKPMTRKSDGSTFIKMGSFLKQLSTDLFGSEIDDAEANFAKIVEEGDGQEFTAKVKSNDAGYVDYYYNGLAAQ